MAVIWLNDDTYRRVLQIGMDKEVRDDTPSKTITFLLEYYLQAKEERAAQRETAQP